MAKASGRQLLGVGLCVALILASSVAWACIPQANLVVVQPQSSGPPGTKVTVEGLGLDPGRAEVRWNSPEGQLLGAGNGPNFSVAVTIPQADGGLYNLLVLSRGAGGVLGNTRAASFLVTPPGNSQVATPSSGAATPKAGGEPASDSGDSGLVVGGVVVLVLLGALAAIVLARRRSGTPGAP